MGRISKKVKTEAIIRYLTFLVEEIDEYFFEEDNNSKVIQSLLAKNKSMVHFLTYGEDDNEKAVILFYYDKSQKTSLIEKIRKYMQDNSLSKNVKRIQLISIVESLDEKMALIKFLKDNKQAIALGSCYASNFEYNVLFMPKVDKKPIELCVSRMNSIIFPDPNVNINIMPSLDDDKPREMAGYIFVASLSDLVEIYNRVGDDLFASNLRYGIADKMSLENSMKSTLLEEPDMFWYYNNGITIVTEQDGIDIENAGKVVLSESWKTQELDFSVINGAQTISTASRIFADSDIPEDKIKKAKREAQVLLRIITAKKNPTRRNITIALNRQKPIRPEDIAFQSAFVTAFNEYMSFRDTSKKTYLYIIKRGEIVFDDNTIELPLFAQLVYASFMNPSDARNQGPAKLYSVGGNDGRLTNTYFRDEFTEANTVSTRESAFNKYYQELIWTYRLYKALNVEIKKYINKENKVILANNRWSFISYILKLLNNFSGEICQIDYSDFQERDEIIVNIRAYMDAFANIVKKAYPDGYKPEDSKSKDFWDNIQKVQLPELFTELKKQDVEKDSNISKTEFIHFLEDMSFNYDGALEEYVAEVDCRAFSSVRISVNDSSFDISAMLFDVFYDMNEDDNSDKEKYEKFAQNVLEKFTLQIGSEPEIVDFPECPDQSVELAYNGVSFEKSFVNKFISVMREINYLGP